MKLTAAPPTSFKTDPDKHFRTPDDALWRVYYRASAHPAAWNKLREFGPVEDMRFDPHPLPKGVHPGIGVTYAASSSQTALAEAFQERLIDRRDMHPAIAGWVPTRPLTLLDLTSRWPVLNKGAAAIMMGDKEYTQAWARAIEYQLRDEIDGLYYLSSVDSQPCMALFTRTQRVNAWPARPDFAVALSDPALKPIMADMVEEYDYKVI